jgi:hypothetical protein
MDSMAFANQTGPDPLGLEINNLKSKDAGQQRRRHISNAAYERRGV